MFTINYSIYELIGETVGKVVPHESLPNIYGGPHIARCLSEILPSQTAAKTITGLNLTNKLIESYMDFNGCKKVDIKNDLIMMVHNLIIDKIVQIIVRVNKLNNVLEDVTKIREAVAQRDLSEYLYTNSNACIRIYTDLNHGVDGYIGCKASFGESLFKFIWSCDGNIFTFNTTRELSLNDQTSTLLPLYFMIGIEGAESLEVSKTIERALVGFRSSNPIAPMYEAFRVLQRNIYKDKEGKQSAG